LRGFFDFPETCFFHGAFFCGGAFLAAKVFGLAATVAAARDAIAAPSPPKFSVTSRVKQTCLVAIRDAPKK